MSEQLRQQAPPAILQPSGTIPSAAQRTGLRLPDWRGFAKPLHYGRKLGGKFLQKSVVLLLFFALWELLPQSGLLDSSILSPFSSVVATLWNGLASGLLLKHIAISLQRAFGGFTTAVLLAIPLGLLMGWFKSFEEIVDPLLQFFRQTAPLALFPVFILLLGLGETSKVFVIFWAALFPVLLNTISGVKEVDHRLTEMARVFGAGDLAIFRRVILPASIPAIAVGLRLSATNAILTLIAAEMIGAKQGLGFLIINSQYNFEIPLMFVAIILLALLGLATNYSLLALQQRLCRWQQSSRH